MSGLARWVVPFVGVAAVLAGCSSATQSVAPPAVPSDSPAPGSVGIVDGTDAKPGQFPWMAASMWVPLGKLGLPLCGGALIAPQFVLTGKHCHSSFPVKNPKSWRVRIGSIRWDSGGQYVKVAKFIDYPDANVDLALIKLASPVAAPTIAYSSPDMSAAYQVGSKAEALGWGTNGGTSILPKTTLQWIGLETAANDTCKGGANGVFCAGRPNNQGAGTCMFDSGSPYVWSKDGFQPDGTPIGTPVATGTLRGILNESCGVKGKNDDFQMTGPPYTDWITTQIGS